MHFGESPGLAHGTPDSGSHSAPVCCVIQGPLLFLSGLQFPHLRTGLALGWWELGDMAYLMGFQSLCSSTLPRHQCTWCVYGGQWGAGGCAGLSDLTSRSILPFQCPPCVHGTQESNVSEERVCWVGQEAAGSGHCLEVGWATSWFRTRGSLCTFTLSARPSPRAGLDPHPPAHQARASWKEVSCSVI